MNEMEHIFLLAGSNMGSAEDNIDRALRALEQNDIHVVRKSTLLKTKPWGKYDQPDFLNMAVEVTCDHSPRELLQVLKKIERQLGRTPDERWGPRIIDLDIVFYGNETVKEDDLVIPHPHFFDRPFAVSLMAEIAPQFIPPGSAVSIADYHRE